MVAIVSGIRSSQASVLMNNPVFMAFRCIFRLNPCLSYNWVIIVAHYPKTDVSQSGYTYEELLRVLQLFLFFSSASIRTICMSIYDVKLPDVSRACCIFCFRAWDACMHDLALTKDTQYFSLTNPVTIFLNEEKRKTKMKEEEEEEKERNHWKPTGRSILARKCYERNRDINQLRNGKF